MTNSAIIRDAYGVPAIFIGSKTGRDDAPFVFVRVGDEERRMRWSEWDAHPAWSGACFSWVGFLFSFLLFCLKIARTGACTATLLLASALGASALAATAAEPNCRAIESTSARLACYDAAFPPQTRKAADVSTDTRPAYKDPFIEEEARTAGRLKNICRGC